MIRLAIAYAALTGAALLLGFLPIESGPLAIALLLSPHLGLLTLALWPVAAVTRSRRLALALAVVAVLFVVRFGSDWVPSPGPDFGSAAALGVATWNVQYSGVPSADAVQFLSDHPVDVVVLEELNPDVAATIEASSALTARWPYRALYPARGAGGIGMLSTYPLVDPQHAVDPVRLEARVQLRGDEVVVLGAHPYPALISRVLGLPFGFDPTVRNADLELLRGRVRDLEGDGARVILLGDFNTAPSEPAFGRLTAGLLDAHREVGGGPGWTWTPLGLRRLGLAFLRIDLILSSSSLPPIATHVDCPRVGDHCLVSATLQLEPLARASRPASARFAP